MLHIKSSSGFVKNLPLKHEYMKTYIKHQKEFGGANNIMVAVRSKEGTIFTPEIFDVIKNVTDELFFIEGVDRSKVSSIFTPNTTYSEVVEDGFAGGPVIPNDFKNTPENINRVRANILKAGIVGRLVSNDFTCAMVQAQLLDINPTTKKQLDYVDFAHKLEDKLRGKYQNDKIAIHIMGYAKIVGDVADALKNVVMFFAIAILITFILVYLYCHSVKLTIVPIACSIIAVVWQLGLLTVFGYGIDPMSVLVPFLIFAIGVSHGMQMINSMGNLVAEGSDPIDAARESFRRLLLPGSIALLSDTVGFLTLLLIQIQVIQELAITASLGVGVIILTNLILLPVIMSYLKFDDRFKEKTKNAGKITGKLWEVVSHFTQPKIGALAIIFAIALFIVSLKYAREMKIGDLHAGASALHEDSRYNLDVKLITERFSIGTDIISIIGETTPNACVNYETMAEIDRFAWYMQNVDGVMSAVSLPGVAKVINAQLNEGILKFMTLPRNENMLVEAIRPINSSTGLLNTECDVMPIMVFTKDHKAETIEVIVAAAKKYIAENPSDKIQFKLATGAVGVMAATNESVSAAQIPMLIWVYTAVILLCAINFRSIRAVLCVILPLILVSSLAQALMTLKQIGLTVNTLPVIALGVGIGVDYGIYIISPLKRYLSSGYDLQQAYLATLKSTGSAVFFTGLTIAVGVITWVFSALKFQVDIGIILSFMFLLNMIGAIVLIPSLASFFWKKAVNGNS